MFQGEADLEGVVGDEAGAEHRDVGPFPLQHLAPVVIEAAGASAAPRLARLGIGVRERGDFNAGESVECELGSVSSQAPVSRFMHYADFLRHH